MKFTQLIPVPWLFSQICGTPIVVFNSSGAGLCRILVSENHRSNAATSVMGEQAEKEPYLV